MNELLTRDNVMRYLRLDDEAEGDLAMTMVEAAVSRAAVYQKREWPEGMPQYTQVACLMMAAQWWEHRDGLNAGNTQTQEIPEGVRALLDLDRYYQVGGV